MKVQLTGIHIISEHKDDNQLYLTFAYEIPSSRKSTSFSVHTHRSESDNKLLVGKFYTMEFKRDYTDSFDEEEVPF